MSQKTDNLIKLALVFFVSLLSFSIGTYVGKKYSDNQHKLSMLEPKKDVAPTHAEEFATESAGEATPAVTAATGTEEAGVTPQKPAALTDSEVAKIAEEFATEEDETEEKIVATIDGNEKEVKTISNTAKSVAKLQAIATLAKAPPVAVAPKAVADKSPGALPPKITLSATTTKPVEKIAPTPVDESESNDERLPASIPAKTEVTPMHFTVQIGSFPTQDEAEKMTKALQNKGYKTSFVPAKVNGQFWYRVNVGLFGTIREAQDYKKEFLEKTSLTSAIVQRVQQ